MKARFITFSMTSKHLNWCWCSELLCLVLLWYVTGLANTAAAQGLLPQGVGLYQFGYRGYQVQDSEYNSSGEVISLGERLNKDFSGEGMLQGKGGGDLKRLAEELKRYDGDNRADDSLLNTIDLGQMEGDIKAQLNVQTFGLGFGLTDNITIFAGVPLIDIQVRSSIRFNGTNNANQIKSMLGELPYEELQAGLEEAALVNIDTINQKFSDAGYHPIGDWQHKGMGDLRLGVRSATGQRLQRNVRYDLGLAATLEIPTGYMEDPSILTDISTSRGYYALDFLLNHKFSFGKHVWAGGSTGYTIGLPANVEKRVFENGQSPYDSLVDSSRQTNVRLKPGNDMLLAASAGLDFSWWSSTYKLGLKRHFTDQYSGSMDGDYGRLGWDSDSSQLYHEIGIGFKTVDAYRRKAFAIPLMIDLNAHIPAKARNEMNETYFEVVFASFFSTPLAQEAKPQRRSPRKNSRSRGTRGFARAH